MGCNPPTYGLTQQRIKEGGGLRLAPALSVGYLLNQSCDHEDGDDHQDSLLPSEFHRGSFR